MNDKKQELNEQEFMQKNVAYYQVFLSAWVENRMEVGKRLLTFSSLGIGLLMIFYSDLESDLQRFFWLIAGVLFLGTITNVLYAFYANSICIECLISKSDEQKKRITEKTLKIMDILNLFAFILGVYVTFLLVLFNY